MQPVPNCETCHTPLDDEGKCVTCAATAEGMAILLREEFAVVREKMDILADKGFAPEMERVPAASEREKQVPRWNLYVPAEEAREAKACLDTDWGSLVEDEAGREAAIRGAKGVDLDAGGEITCPACGHKFVMAQGVEECPDCGLGLGGPE